MSLGVYLLYLEVETGRGLAYSIPIKHDDKSYKVRIDGNNCVNIITNQL